MANNGEQHSSSSDPNPFGKGAQVEASFVEEGFRGSWYTATVLRPPTKRSSKLLLEFHSLVASDDVHHPLRESVDVVLVRPVPPREARRGFLVSDDVDAFHSDGWWEGIVIAVLDGGERYSVFFRSSREQIDFHESQLRIHREWFYGKWEPPMEDDGGEASPKEGS